MDEIQTEICWNIQVISIRNGTNFDISVYVTIMYFPIIYISTSISVIMIWLRSTTHYKSKFPVRFISFVDAISISIALDLMDKRRLFYGTFLFLAWECYLHVYSRFRGTWNYFWLIFLMVINTNSKWVVTASFPCILIPNVFRKNEVQHAGYHTYTTHFSQFTAGF